MASFATEDDDGDFADQLNQFQGDSSFLSFDGDEHHQPDQGYAFVASDDDSSVDEQSDQEDDISIVDNGDFFGDQEQLPDQPDLFTAFLTEAIRSFTPDGFTSHADADDDPAATSSYAEYYGDIDFALINFLVEAAGVYYSEYYHDDVDFELEDEDEGDEGYLFPVEEAAIAVALEAAEAPDDDCCPVCLQQDDDEEEEDDGAAWSRVTACGHRFHSACVEKWLRVKPTCPVCRCLAAPAAAAEHPAIVDVEELMALGYNSYELAEVSMLLANIPL